MATPGMTNHVEAQRVLEAMMMEEERFKSNKLMAERVLSVAPAQPTVSNGFMLTGGSLLKPPSVSGAPGPLTDLEALMPSATPASDEALKRRVNSLEENNAVLQHRVGQLEAAVAVLARLVEHPLVKQALDGQDEPDEEPPVKVQKVDVKGKAVRSSSRSAEKNKTGNFSAPEKVERIIARVSRDRSGSEGAEDAQSSGGEDGEDGDADNEENDLLKSLKRSKSGKVTVDGDVSKKKWYELIALIKEMKPNNGYPIKCLILAAIESARADPVYADSNIPARLEQSLENYCRKSAGPTKRSALQVLDSVWQFVQQGQAPPPEDA